VIRDVVLDICVVCYVVCLYMVSVDIGYCSWLRLIPCVDVGIGSFGNDQMVRNLVLRSSGIGGSKNLQLRWYCRASVDLG